MAYSLKTILFVLLVQFSLSAAYAQNTWEAIFQIPAQFRIAILPTLIQPVQAVSTDEFVARGHTRGSFGVELSFFQPILPNTGLVFTGGIRQIGYTLSIPNRDSSTNSWVETKISNSFVSVPHLGVGIQQLIEWKEDVFFSVEGAVSAHFVPRRSAGMGLNNPGLRPVYFDFSNIDDPELEKMVWGIGLRAGVLVFPNRQHTIQGNLVGYWSPVPIANGTYTVGSGMDALRGNLILRHSYMGMELRFGLSTRKKEKPEMKK